MTDTSDANKERNREIARNEEAKQVTGSIRVSTWAGRSRWSSSSAGSCLRSAGWR
jgi:hypothetical protein